MPNAELFDEGLERERAQLWAGGERHDVIHIQEQEHEAGVVGDIVDAR